MNKNHRRNLRKLSKKFNITIEESIEKFYKNQEIDKNVVFSIFKKRNKGGLGKSKRNRLRKLKEKQKTTVDLDDKK